MTRTDELSLKRPIIGSAIVHLVLALMLALSTRPAPLVEPPVYRVSLTAAPPGSRAVGEVKPISTASRPLVAPAAPAPSRTVPDVARKMATRSAKPAMTRRPVTATPRPSSVLEKPVSQIPGTGSPRYPDALRSSGVEGEVQAQFVVDENGKAETGSFKVLKATNDLFANAVRTALPSMRFYAAEVGGHKVKQLVQQSFQFKLDR